MRKACAVLALVGSTLLCMNSASAYTFQTLYSFCVNGFPCLDGETPGSRLTSDPEGNLFGTTGGGGSGYNMQGVAFELVNRGGGRWKYRVIHNFCSELDCTDGAEASSLISDTNGVLYGTTFDAGGVYNLGIAFRLVPNTRKTKYRFEKLYDFCPQPGCADGSAPFGLTYAGANLGRFYDDRTPLYGLANNSSARGVIFALTKGKPWKETVVYTFCSQTDCLDGTGASEISVEASGKTIYGVSPQGGPKVGSSTYGVLFQLSKRMGSWKETVLHNFCTSLPCIDGRDPSSLVSDGNGSLFGTTFQGGDADSGTAFQYLLNGNQFSRLYSFCLDPPTCSDGSYPVDIILDGQGTLFGSTYAGGSSAQAGVIFQLNGGNEQVLHAFCLQDGCPDGRSPLFGLIVDASGNRSGVTHAGGAYGDGTVFQLSP